MLKVLLRLELANLRCWSRPEWGKIWVKIENIKSNWKQTIVWEWDGKSISCYVFNAKHVSCSSIHADMCMILSKKALEITTFRDKLRECYRYREWAERERELGTEKRGKMGFFSSFLLAALTSCWWDIERGRRTRSSHWWWSSGRGWPGRPCPRSSRSGSLPRWFAWDEHYSHYWSMFVPLLDTSVTNHSNVHSCHR